MKTPTQLQREHREWQELNFGPQPPYRCLLGIIEEMGELDDALDDADEKDIDGDTPAILDAVGDVLIYTMGYCTARGWSFSELFAAPEVCVKQGPMVIAGQLSHAQLKFEQKIRGSADAHANDSKEALIELLSWLRVVANKPLLIILNEVWEKVSKRDWKKDTNNGGELS